jgi:hypothetical protein
MSDTLTMRAALRAATRARAIAVSRESDDDAVRLLVERMEHEFKEASNATGLCVAEGKVALKKESWFFKSARSPPHAGTPSHAALRWSLRLPNSRVVPTNVASHLLVLSVFGALRQESQETEGA